MSSVPVHPVPSITYPLRVGVIGQTVGVDVEAARRAVAKYVEGLAMRLWDRGGATPVRWVVISSLSSRADVAVVDEILTRLNDRPAGSQHRSASLDVVLPFPPEVHKEGLPSDARPRFSALVQQAGHHVSTIDDGGASAAQRAWERVVASSELVFVVCNEAPDDDPEMVSVIDYALGSGRHVFWLYASSADETLYRLRLATQPTVEPDTIREKRFQLGPMPRRRPELSQGFVRLSAFNQQQRSSSVATARNAELFRNEIVGHARAAGLDQELVAPLQERIIPLAAKADVLANMHGMLYRRTQEAMYGLAAAAVTLGVAQAIVFPQYKWLLLLKVGAIGISLVVLWWVRRHFVHDRWLYSRYLAEQLRSAMFLLPLGVKRFDRAAARHWALPLFSGTDSHVSAAVWSELKMCSRSMTAARHAAPLESLRRFVIDGWIHQQMQWHESNAKKKHHRAHRHHTMTLIFLVMTVAAVVLYLLMHCLHIGVGAEDGPKWQDPSAWVKLIAIVSPAWAAAWHGVGRHEEDERVSVRSGELSRRLAQSVMRAEAAASLEQLQEEAEQAADIMAAELQDWLVQLSFYPPAPVV